MSSLIDKLKKKSDSLSKLQSEVDKSNTKASYDDARFWEPKVDPKTKNGYAVIRFLPEIATEDVPWIRFWKHAFQGPTGKWYIENCLTTLHKDCPVCEANNKLWDTGIEANKTIVRARKRGLVYISNILVISDPERPENEGKVFLFKYGKSIFDKIDELLHPQFPTDVASNPFNFWTGSNFVLKVRNKEGYRSYDKSTFESPSVLSEDDEYLEQIYNSQYALKEFVGEDQFKSYDQLKAHFNKVWNTSVVVGSAEDEQLDDETDEEETTTELPWKKEEVAVDPKKKTLPKLTKKKSTVVDNAEDEKDDPLSRFRGLAEED